MHPESIQISVLPACADIGDRISICADVCTPCAQVAKVKAVEESIEMCHRLQNEVGSYALMGGTGFEQKDFLTCCKFAEGDRFLDSRLQNNLFT